ncbi:Phage tail tube protein [compost metagenome]
MKATIVDSADLPLKQLMEATDQTVTVEFKNGRVYVLAGGFVVAEPSAKGDDGTIDIQWDGNKGGFQ